MRIIVVATRSLGATSTLAGAMHNCTISFIRQQSLVKGVALDREQSADVLLWGMTAGEIAESMHTKRRSVGLLRETMGKEAM